MARPSRSCSRTTRVTRTPEARSSRAGGGEYFAGSATLPLDEVVPPGSALASHGGWLFGGRVPETDDQLGTHPPGSLRIVARAVRLKEVTGPAASPMLCAASSRVAPAVPTSM